MKVAFIDVDGIRTRYVFSEAGGRVSEGRPLLLLHSGLTDAGSWVHNIDGLATDRSVFALDMVGHGFTQPVDLGGQPPHETTLAHLLAWIDLMGWTEFDVAGSSFGALLAAHLYFQRPHQVSHLVMVGSGASFGRAAERGPAATGAEAIVRSLETPTLESLRALDGMFAVPSEVLHARLTSYSLPGAHDYRMAMVRSVRDVDAWSSFRILDRLEELAPPTLVVWGREDPNPWEQAAEAVERMPRARLVVFDGCGHLVYVDDAERFNTTVDEFLREPVVGPL